MVANNSLLSNCDFDLHDVQLMGTSNTDDVVTGEGFATSLLLDDFPSCSTNDGIHTGIGENDRLMFHNKDISYYDCVDTISLCPTSIRLTPRHLIGGYKSQMNWSVWEYYLQYECDRDLADYISNGIRRGFDIVDTDSDISSYFMGNYSSVYSGQAHDYINDLILSEIAEGKYVRADFVPKCIHALGAIPKDDSTFRPITDCKRPIGVSINNFMSTTAQDFSYKSVDDVASNMSKNCFMATVDISSAYRSISVNPDHWTYQGIMWDVLEEDEHLVDSRLCFGLKCAPFIFTQLSNFITSTMAKLGYDFVVNYLDDFIVFGKDYVECQTAQSTLITLLGQFGFNVSWKKCSSPAQCVRYLGILFDSVNMKLMLPDDKLEKLATELKFFENKVRATKRQLQRLCGVLSYTAKVIKGARTFSRKVIDLLKGLPEGNPRVKLSADFHADLDWWRRWSPQFNGAAYVIDRNWGEGPTIYSDASFSGYGAIFDEDWIGGFFNSTDLPKFTCDSCHSFHWFNIHVPEINNINYLELIPVYLAVMLLAPSCRDSHIVCYTDNTQVVAMVNKGTSVNDSAMVLLRELFWLSVIFNLHVTARHIPGKLNVSADYISRVSTNMNLSDFPSKLCCSHHPTGIG